MFHKNVIKKDKGNFRFLEVAELENVSGGILVWGDRPPDSNWGDIGPGGIYDNTWNENPDILGDGPSGGGGGNQPDEEGCNDHSTGDESEYPPGFDQELDRQIDELAAEIANEFLTLPNPETHEAIALIWIDSQGNLHRTGAYEGTPDAAPIGMAWPNVDFANGGQVVGIIHSHPTLYNNGAGFAPVAEPNHHLSNGDFNTLIEAANGTLQGFDQDNVRSYIAQNGLVNEYYAFDQDESQYGQDATTTIDSVESGDYDENTGQESQGDQECS